MSNIEHNFGRGSLRDEVNIASKNYLGSWKLSISRVKHNSLQWISPSGRHGEAMRIPTPYCLAFGRGLTVCSSGKSALVQTRCL